MGWALRVCFDRLSMSGCGALIPKPAQPELVEGRALT